MNPPTARVSNLDYLRSILTGTVTPTDKSPFNFPFPIMKTLGFRLVEVSEGTASMEMEVKTDLHSNPMGTIHGGVLCDIADAAIGTAHLLYVLLANVSGNRRALANLCKTRRFRARPSWPES
jgi:hypothetical protein